MEWTFYINNTFAGFLTDKQVGWLLAMRRCAKDCLFDVHMDLVHAVVVLE